MNILADESVEGATVLRLREASHSVIYVAELDPGIKDPAVLALARQTNSLLLTADKDFGELVFRRRELHSGVLLVRLPDGQALENSDLIVQVINQHSNALVSCFSVLSKQGLRIRSFTAAKSD